MSFLFAFALTPDHNVYIQLNPLVLCYMCSVYRIRRTSCCNFSCLLKNLVWRHGAILFFDSNLDSCPEPVYTACFTNCIHINNNIVHTLSLPQASGCARPFYFSYSTYRLLTSFPTTHTFGEKKNKLLLTIAIEH